MLGEKNITVIGAGTVGTALIDALLSAGISPSRLRATARHRERAIRCGDAEVRVTRGNRAAVRRADIVLVCVKPQYVRDVLEEVAADLRPGALLISTATGVTITSMEQSLGDSLAVVRAMPNTACRIRQGMTVLARGRHANDASMSIATGLFRLMGKAIEADECHMDAVTALSASGPAFVFTILESLAEGGVRVGLPRELATLLAAQATLGAAAMVLETGQHPALLKSEVTTPGGCTVDGILELEDGKIRACLIRAVATTTKKAARLPLAEAPALTSRTSHAQVPGD